MTAKAYRPAHAGHPTPEKPWKVQLYVRGHHSGEYSYCTLAMAFLHAKESRAAFGVLGCAYRITGPRGLAWSEP